LSLCVCVVGTLSDSRVINFDCVRIG